MEPIPIELPPGIVKNGTPYQRRGRWVDCNLIRWDNGVIKPIGGWLRRQDNTFANVPALFADPTLEAVRDTHSWRSINQDQNVVFGSNRGLYHLDQIGTLTDITPAGMVTTGKDASASAGYGQNPYGVGAYGVANPLIAQDPIPPRRWGFDNFGQVLLAQQRGVAELYELDLNTLTTSVVTNAPTDNFDVLVTDQRIVMLIGADGEPRKVQWSDQEDRTVWTPQVNNQAGSQTLAGSGKLYRGLTVLKQVLIVGENDAHVARYLGPPYVFGFDIVGRNCGAICPEAVVGIDRFAIWWGERQFWLFDGAVKAVPCDVIEYLYDDIDEAQVSKITGFTNTEFSEVWWLYQSLSSTTTECDSYVVFNYITGTWLIGRLDRTAGLDRGVLSYPTYVSSDGIIYTHEIQTIGVPEGTPFVESGEIDIANGAKNVAVRALYPDTQEFGDVSVEIIGKQFPTGTEYTYGPYTYANPTDTRAMGRSVKFRFTGVNERFEIGTFRMDIAPINTGKR